MPFHPRNITQDILALMQSNHISSNPNAIDFDMHHLCTTKTMPIKLQIDLIKCPVLKFVDKTYN